MKALHYTALLLLFCFTSCVTLEKSIDKITQSEVNAKLANQAIKDKYELVSASDCSKWFPIQEKIVTRVDTVKTTVTIPGKEIQCPETVDTQTGKKYIPVVKCPDTHYEQQTIRELTEKTQESTAKVRILELKNEKAELAIKIQFEEIARLNENIAKAEQEKSRYLKALGIIAFLAVVAIVLKFFKPF